MNKYSRLARCVLLIVCVGAPICPPASATAETMQAAPPAVTINGFRSAQFGMDETAVRRCIASDFRLKGKAVQSVTDPDNQTKNISVQVPGLLGGLGKANIDYILGYRSHRLMEVVVVWSGMTDPENAGPAILSAARELHGYFLSEGFPDAAAKVSKPGQIQMFYGKDSSGHTILLELKGEMSKPNSKDQQNFAPTALLVGYAQDPDHPDIFALPKGAF